MQETGDRDSMTGENGREEKAPLRAASANPLTSPSPLHHLLSPRSLADLSFGSCQPSLNTWEEGGPGRGRDHSRLWAETELPAGASPFQTPFSDR